MSTGKVMGIDVALYQRLKKIDDRLREHDESIVGFGELYVQLSHKLGIVIRQTADVPLIRDDIAYLKAEAAHTRNRFSKINEQLIKMEAKDDYLLERLNEITPPATAE